jgi:3-hydroxyisobutyrate dehydrogenase
MKVGFLGTGLMGQAMVKRLLSVGVAVVAYNRTESKLAPLQEAGAEVSSNPLDVIRASDCLILMLSDTAAIQDTLFSEKIASQLANRTIIQMGTISPSQSQEIHRKVIKNGGDYLEAPVLGSIPEAEAGKLLLMVGASQEQFEKWFQLLQHLGSEPMLIGEVGTAAAMKLALNQLIASLTASFALSLGFLERQGVNVEKFMEILRQSALYAPTFDKKLQRMRDRNYANPNFPTKHLLKDVDLFIAQGEEINLNLASLEGVRQIVRDAVESGFSQEDYSALFSAIEKGKSK